MAVRGERPEFPTSRFSGAYNDEGIGTSVRGYNKHIVRTHDYCTYDFSTSIHVRGTGWRVSQLIVHIQHSCRHPWSKHRSREWRRGRAHWPLLLTCMTHLYYINMVWKIHAQTWDWAGNFEFEFFALQTEVIQIYNSMFILDYLLLLGVSLFDMRWCYIYPIKRHLTICYRNSPELGLNWGH